MEGYLFKASEMNDLLERAGVPQRVVVGEPVAPPLYALLRAIIDRLPPQATTVSA